MKNAKIICGRLTSCLGRTPLHLTLHPPIHPHRFRFSFYDFRSWQSSKRRGTRLQSSIVIVCTSLLYARSQSLPYCSINSQFLSSVRFLEHTLIRQDRQNTELLEDGWTTEIKRTEPIWQFESGTKREKQIKEQMENIYQCARILNKRKYTFLKKFIGFRIIGTTNIKRSAHFSQE